MNWDAISAIAETVGGLATVAMLVFLSLQIRQNTVSQKTSNYLNLNSEIAQLLQSGVGSILTSPPADLDEDELMRRYNHLAAYFVVYESLYYVNLDGGVEPEIWESREEQIKLFLNSEFGRGFWKERSIWFAKSFRDHVSSLVSSDA